MAILGCDQLYLDDWLLDAFWYPVACLPWCSDTGPRVGGVLRLWLWFWLRSFSLLLLPALAPGLPPLVCPLVAGSIFRVWLLVDVEGSAIAAFRRVAAAVGGLFHRKGGGTGRRHLFHRFHLHVKAGLLGTADMEGSVTVDLIALDAFSCSFLFTQGSKGI